MVSHAQLQSPASVLDISDVQFGAHFILSVPPGAGGSATLNATGFNANYGSIELLSPGSPPEFSPPFTITLSDLAPSAQALAAIPVVEFGGAVGSGQTLSITDVAHVVLDKPGQFHALIRGFEPQVSSPSSVYDSFFQPEFILSNTQVTSYAVANDVLSLWDGTSLVAQLRFSDFTYTKANFLVSSQNGSTIIEPEGGLTPVVAASHSAVADHLLG